MSLTNKPEIICTWRDKYSGEDKTILQVIDEAIIDNTIPYTQEGIDSIIWHCDDFVANEDKKSKLIRALNVLEMTFIIYNVVNIETVMKTVKLEFIYR